MRGAGAMMGLTYDLDVYVSAVRHVLNLDGQSVLPRVGPLRGADEEDGVHFTGASSHRLVLQGNAVSEPGHNRTRLTLQSERRTGIKTKCCEEKNLK